MNQITLERVPLCDHRVSFMNCLVPHIMLFKCLSHSYRYFNEESIEHFKHWIVPREWDEVLLHSHTTQDKALAYQLVLNEAVNKCFPLITVRRKNTDPPGKT